LRGITHPSHQGYRARAIELIHQHRLRALLPVDFVIAQLRRGTELDLDDAFLKETLH
jgi:hypothetical protein